MNVTIYDIARETGLSAATVSRVLSGKNTVKADTEALVLDCANRLGYTNRRTNKTVRNAGKKIMVLVEDLSNLFYIGIIQGISSLMAPAGYKVAVFQTSNVVSLEEEYVEFAHEDNYAGIIMITAIGTPNLIELLKKNTCPVVLVNRFIRSLDLNSVCIDNFRGGYIATKYLSDNGHKKIAHLAGPSCSTASDDRCRGYMAALKDAGLPYDPKAVYYGDLTSSSGIAFGEYFIKTLRDYTAVFAANDLMATTFMKVLNEKGLGVPKDVSLICFDDAEATRNQVKLTTVSRDPVSMGKVTGEMMMGMLSSTNSLPRKIVFPPVLNERESVSPLHT